MLTYGSVFGGEDKSKRVDIQDPNKKSAARFFRKEKKKTKDQLVEEKLKQLEQLENTLSNK